MLSPLGWDRYGAEWSWCTKRSQVVNCLHLEFHPSARLLLVCYPVSYFYPVPLSSFACVVCACVLCIVYCVYCVFASYHQSDVQSSINPSHPSTLTSWVHKAPKHFMLLLPFSTTCLDLEVGIPSSFSCLLSWPEHHEIDTFSRAKWVLAIFEAFVWHKHDPQHRGFLTPEYNLLRESTPPTLQIPLTVLDPAGRWTTFISDRAF